MLWSKVFKLLGSVDGCRHIMDPENDPHRVMKSEEYYQHWLKTNDYFIPQLRHYEMDDEIFWELIYLRKDYLHRIRERGSIHSICMSTFHRYEAIYLERIRKLEREKKTLKSSYDQVTRAKETLTSSYNELLITHAVAARELNWCMIVIVIAVPTIVFLMRTAGYL
jgi:hypothetical protein